MLQCTEFFFFFYLSQDSKPITSRVDLVLKLNMKQYLHPIGATVGENVVEPLLLRVACLPLHPTHIITLTILIASTIFHNQRGPS